MKWIHFLRRNSHSRAGILPPFQGAVVQNDIPSLSIFSIWKLIEKHENNLERRHPLPSLLHLLQHSWPPKCGHLHAESSFLFKKQKPISHRVFHGLFVAYTYFSVLVFELRKLLLFLRWVFYHKVTFSTLIYLFQQW